MPRVLILTYHFPPSAASGSFRMLGFARHLPKTGWDVAVVSPPTLPWEAADPRLVEQVPPGTLVYQAPYSLSRVGKPLRKFAPYAVWLPRALKQGHHAILQARPDALLSSGPPHWIHLVAAHLKRRHGLPWVADFRDPWVVGRQAEVNIVRLAPGLERRVMREADAVVWNTQAVCEELQEAYPDQAAKMIAVPNGYDPEQFGARERSSSAGEALEILHAGSIYLGRDPRPVLDAIKALKESGMGLRASFLGGAAGLDLDAEARARGLEQAVAVEGNVPYDEALRRMVQSDVLLLIDHPGRRTGVPAKLYEYIGAGRPILALGEADGDLAWVLKESGRPHRIAPPGDVVAIRRSLAELGSIAREQQGGYLTEPGPSRFTREELARSMAVVLNRCADVGAAPACPSSVAATGGA